MPSILLVVDSPQTSRKVSNDKWSRFYSNVKDTLDSLPTRNRLSENVWLFSLNSQLYHFSKVSGLAQHFGLEHRSLILQDESSWVSFIPPEIEKD